MLVLNQYGRWMYSTPAALQGYRMLTFKGKKPVPQVMARQCIFKQTEKIIRLTEKCDQMAYTYKMPK